MDVQTWRIAYFARRVTIQSCHAKLETGQRKIWTVENLGAVK